MTVGAPPGSLALRPGNCGWVTVGGVPHRGVVLFVRDDGSAIIAYGTSKEHDDFGDERRIESNEEAGRVLRCTTTTYFYEKTLVEGTLTPPLLAQRCPRGLWKKLRSLHQLG